MAAARVALVLTALALAAAQDLTLEAAYSVGVPGMGYTFALPDGDGNMLSATTTEGSGQGSIMLSPFGTVDADPTQTVALDESKGRVTCGCVMEVLGVKHLFGGLSQKGRVFDLNLVTFEITYLTARSDEPWNTPSSAVCANGYVYFGTKSTSTTSATATIVRLDPSDTASSTRFKRIAPFAYGSLARGANYGDEDVIFVSQPTSAFPATIYRLSPGPSFLFETSVMKSNFLNSLSSFSPITGLYGDADNSRAVVVNGMGNGRIVAVNMSNTHGDILETVTLGTGPITSAVTDPGAGVMYVTTGSCTSVADVTMHALRVAGGLEELANSTYEATLYDCMTDGLPAAAAVDASGDSRRVHVATLTSTDGVGEGRMVPFVALAATACSMNCGGMERGDCVAGVCMCKQQYNGTACELDAPCGGSTCNGHGTCNTNTNVCSCSTGYTGTECSELVHCPEDCSGRGTCSAYGNCNCSAGFAGRACQYHAVGCDSLSGCNGHGTCTEGYPTGTCACDGNWTARDCGTAITGCPDDCSGHGECLADWTCNCSAGWKGESCSKVVTDCPNDCHDNGVCYHARCTCFRGFKGVSCGIVDGSYCAAGCTGHGSCVSGVCKCEAGWKGAQCTTKISDLSVISTLTLPAGEDKSTATFNMWNSQMSRDEVVMCLGTTPGKCVSVSAVNDSLARQSAVDFKQAVPVRRSRARASGAMNLLAAQALQADDGSTNGSNASNSTPMVEGTSSPISTAVVDEANNVALLGLADGGDVLKVTLDTMGLVKKEPLAEGLEGVTAAVGLGNGTYLFAADGVLYHINKDLVVLSEIALPTDDGIPANVSVLLTDGSRGAIAAAGTKVWLVDVRVTPMSVIGMTDIGPMSLSETGDIFSGAVDKAKSPALAMLGTDSSPALIVEVLMVMDGDQSGPQLGRSVRLKAGEDAAMSAVEQDGFFYFGLKSAGSSCFIAKISTVNMTEMDSLDVKGCTTALVTATASRRDPVAFFTDMGSPASLYEVRLLASTQCLNDCTGRGACVNGSCVCNAGFEGPSCATVTAICKGQPSCTGNGTCISGLCLCNPNHYGDDCSHSAPIGSCLDLCVNGLCVGGNESWPCGCDVGFQGQYCNILVSTSPTTSPSPMATPSASSTPEVSETPSSGPTTSPEPTPSASEEVGMDETAAAGGGAAAAIMGVVGLMVGAVVGVSLWKSYVKSVEQSQIIGSVSSPLDGAYVQAAGAGGGYARLPRRLAP